MKSIIPMINITPEIIIHKNAIKHPKQLYTTLLTKLSPTFSKKKRYGTINNNVIPTINTASA